MIRKLLLIVLIIIALVMIYLGYSAKMLPPALTGVGFLIIGCLLFKRNSIS